MIQVNGLAKIYQNGSVEVAALQGINLSIGREEFVAIMGPSGSGKSTLMNILGCLDRPTRGSYLLNDREVAYLSDDELADVRSRTIGFIFQTFNLLPRISALQNVELPMVYAGVERTDRRDRAMEALRQVGLADRSHHRPNEMSGGQRQRVAIARSLVNRPTLLLADEPTGNLDSQSGKDIMRLLQNLHERGMAIILVTHDAQVALHSERIVRFHDGRIVADEKVAERTRV